MKNSDLDYLNGFLQAMALVNVGTNHGCWYLIEPIDRKATLEESLDFYFADFLTSLSIRYGPAERRIQGVLLPEWSASVVEAAHRWFFESACSPKLHEAYQAKIVTTDFVDRLGKALMGNISAWSIEGGSNDNEWTDVLLEDQDGYYLLRFSHCD